MIRPHLNVVRSREHKGIAEDSKGDEEVVNEDAKGELTMV